MASGLAVNRRAVCFGVGTEVPASFSGGGRRALGASGRARPIAASRPGKQRRLFPEKAFGLRESVALPAENCGEAAGQAGFPEGSSPESLRLPVSVCRLLGGSPSDRRSPSQGRAPPAPRGPSGGSGGSPGSCLAQGRQGLRGEPGCLPGPPPPQEARGCRIRAVSQGRAAFITAPG